MREVGPLAFELPAGPHTLERSKVAFLGDEHWLPGLFFMAIACVRMVPYVAKAAPQRAQFALLLAIKALTVLHTGGD